MREIEEPGHIATKRLFNTTRADLEGKFQLEDWECEHLAKCPECQHVKEVFSRQFTAMKPQEAA